MEPALDQILQAWLGLQGRSLSPDLFYKSLFQKTSNFHFAFGLSAVGRGLLILPVPKAQVLGRRGLPAVEEARAEHLCSLIDLLFSLPGESSNQYRHLCRLLSTTKFSKSCTHSANPTLRLSNSQLAAQPGSPLQCP